MSAPATLAALRDELRDELVRGILPYWMTHCLDHVHGGFVGFVGEDEVARPGAPKGGILTARLVWTFAAAHRVLGGAGYRAMAERALDTLRRHLTDRVHGGVYWMIEADGAPLDTRKHVYAQAFAIYALSEVARATGDEAALAEAIALHELVERHAHDAAHGGYAEAFARDWSPLDDVRLGDTDANEPRSMNTHLHLLEAYTNLYRVWPAARLRERLVELVTLFVDHVARDDGHLCLFFDERWTPRSAARSYGHDVEASWLLLEAADVLGDDRLRARARATSLALADAVLAEAVDPVLGGLFYERAPGEPVDMEKEWWPQAEAIVGFVAAHEATGDAAFLRAAASTWSFTREHLVDRAHGDWFRRVARDGARLPGHEKAGPWKCPYHNARACLEVIERAARAGHEDTHDEQQDERHDTHPEHARR